MRFLFVFLVPCLVSSFVASTYIPVPSNGDSDTTYLIGTQNVTWYEAYVLCKQDGMELASINSLEEETALENYAKTVDVKTGFYGGLWTAGTRNGACASEFVWFSTGKPLIYQKFSPGEPDNSGGVEACIEFFINVENNDYEWNDINCDDKLGFICQTSKSC